MKKQKQKHKGEIAEAKQKVADLEFHLKRLDPLCDRTDPLIVRSRAALQALMDSIGENATPSA